MKWIEVIRISSAENGRAALEDELTLITKQLSSEEPACQFQLYRSLTDADICIHLSWNKGKPERRGSKIGRCLAHMLKEFGYISLSVWVSEKN